MGFATEATRALLHCAAQRLADQPIVIITQAANLAALRLADRLGFTRVETFEQFSAEQVQAKAQLRTFLRQ
ncbi:GNAT family N-acetyltransferase [Mycobacterium sp. NPDC050441]|uniref:GNAT family N-acetyltransferase n=1 Tax=Mycobacterium sp. NPDC050441 TaxID=3155403 RepID=UPI00340C92CD